MDSDEMGGIKINGKLIKRNGSERSKTKVLVVVIPSSIIKQFEQMSKNAKYLKMCPSANVWFAEFC